MSEVSTPASGREPRRRTPGGAGSAAPRPGADIEDTAVDSVAEQLETGQNTAKHSILFKVSIVVSKGITQGYPRYAHDEAKGPGVRIAFDEAVVLAATGIELEHSAILELGDIAGRFGGAVRASSENAGVADVRRLLDRVISKVQGLRKSLKDDPGADGLVLELVLLSAFSAENPQRTPNIPRMDLDQIWQALESLEGQLTFLRRGHKDNRAAMESGFGVSNVTAWDTLVGELADWCRRHGVPGEFHARVEGAEHPPFRRLIHLVEDSIGGWRRLERSVEAEIKAISRALKAAPGGSADS